LPPLPARTAHEALKEIKERMMKPSNRMQKIIEKMAKARDVDLSKPGTHFKAQSDGFMDLVIENAGLNKISVAHYYEQNGDLCQDPEICFLVGCDGRWYPYEWTTPGVMMFGRVIGGYKNYGEVDGVRGEFKTVARNGQRKLATFANQWADNLRMQRFT